MHLSMFRLGVKSWLNLSDHISEIKPNEGIDSIARRVYDIINLKQELSIAKSYVVGKDMLKIIPLGGLGEIGLNMMVLEYDQYILVVRYTYCK